MVFFLISGTTAFCRRVVKCCQWVPNYLLDCLSFIAKLIWSFNISSFVKCHAVLSPSAFNLQGFSRLFFSPLASFSGVHFSIDKYLEFFGICLSLCMQLQRCRTERCRMDRKQPRSTISVPYHWEKQNFSSCPCHHTTVCSDIALTPPWPPWSAAWCQLQSCTRSSRAIKVLFELWISVERSNLSELNQTI